MIAMIMTLLPMFFELELDTHVGVPKIQESLLGTTIRRFCGLH